MNQQQFFFIGVDVGTGSARAGVFDSTGRMLGQATRTIAMWNPQPEYYEQSSENIWQAVAQCVKAAMTESKASPTSVRGIGFDATCSLVVLDAADRPVTVSPTGKDDQNIIVWMDHRAIPQAQRINAAGHAVLQYVGGKVSPEMQTPKLLWLKENMPDTWRRAARFLDLPDYLTYRATGDDTRSLCTTVCKWTYLGHEKPDQPGSVGRWDASYFRQIGLADLADEKFVRIGTRVRPMGEALGCGPHGSRGLTARAAADLGLPAGIAVGVGIIDAHAGGIGVLGAAIDGKQPAVDDIGARLALICGTSSCHMAASGEARFIPGIWGPYFSAMLPDLWLTEGGQSAVGSLIDHIIDTYADAGLKEQAAQAGISIYESLNQHLEIMAKAEPFAARLTRELHVGPYFHGNRSPRADPTLRGMVVGLKLVATLDDLAMLYLATIQAIAYGTRHIIADMNAKGYRINTILACGGLTKNPVFLREHADVTGCRIVLPAEPESMLLGSAVLGAVAAGAYPNVMAAMGNMSRAGRVIVPQAGPVAAYHHAKYEVFHRLYADQMAYRQIMSKV